MAVLEWNQQMSVGLSELDDDHKQLIRVINQLGADHDDQARQGAVRQSLFALLRYAEFHFAREEGVMAACNYPGIEEHKKEHRDFVRKMRDLNRRFDEDPQRSAEVVNADLLGFLQDWLSHHILVEDMAYRPYAESSPEARKAAKSFKATQIWWTG